MESMPVIAEAVALTVRANMGRQRIEVHKLEKASNRQVTFSKRRFGVFKKASELCTLSGAEIALIIDSPAKKTYSFGYPTMEAVIDRYENMNAPLANNGNTEQLIEAARRRKTHDLMAELDAINEDLHKETLKRNVLNKKEKAGQTQNWYERSVDCINDKEQLNFFKNVLRELGDMVAQHSEMLRQKQVGLMQQNAAMVQQAELMQQNTTIGAIRDFMQPRAAAARPFYKGNSSSSNVMNPYGPMPSSSPPPPPAEPWNPNLESRQFF